MDKKPTHRNTSCGNLRRPHRIKTLTVWCCLLLQVAAFLASAYTGRPCASFVVERVPPQGAPYMGAQRYQALTMQYGMEPKTGYTLQQLWADSEPAIGKKSSPSYEIKESDILRAVAAIANLPSPRLPDSPFIRALGTPAAHKASPQTDTLAQRALEEWERTLYSHTWISSNSNSKHKRFASDLSR